jgi:hypothetical protein
MSPAVKNKVPDFKRLDRTGAKLDALQPMTDAPSVEAQTDDDHHRNAPRPDDACLYGLIGDIARAGGDTTEANPFAIALNALAYLSCCVGRGPYLPVGNTYHHARLFTMHVGRSGRGRKGDAVSIIHRIDMALRQSDGHLAPQVHRGGLSSREGLAFLMHDGFKEGKNDLEAIHDKRLWIVESEFANVLQQTKRDGNTLSAALRDCWDGVAIKPATKTNRISASHPHVSLSAAVTPGELMSLMQARELSNGFANRFIAIYSERTTMVAFPQKPEQTVVDDLARRVADVLRFAGAERYAERDHMRMTLSPSAAAIYGELYMGELNRHDYGALVTGLLERRAPVLLRIAMLLALTDKTVVIEPGHIQAALAWVRYWVESVRFIFSSAAQEDAQHKVAETAQKIVAFLQASGRQRRTYITTKCFQGKLPKSRIDLALDELLQATPSAIRVETVARSDGPGSPTKFYSLRANSANSGNCDDSRGFAGGSGASEVGELSEISQVVAVGGVASTPTVRSVRQTANAEITRANAHGSQSSLISPAPSNVEGF